MDVRQLEQTQEEVSRCRWLQGTIVGRRVLGKHLAFATLQLCSDEQQQHAENDVKPALVKVQFRRQVHTAAVADAPLLPDATAAAPCTLSAQASVWEDADSSFFAQKFAERICSGRECDHEQCEPAPFPQRRSQLQLGARVLVKVCPQTGDDQAPLAVMSWRVLAQVGEKSCSDATASSVSGTIVAQDVRITLLSNAMDVADASGKGARGLACAGRSPSFFVSDRQRVRQLAHSDALAARACSNASGRPDLPLCKHWMVKGVCEDHQRGQCDGYRMSLHCDTKHCDRFAARVPNDSLVCSKQTCHVVPQDTTLHMRWSNSVRSATR